MPGAYQPTNNAYQGTGQFAYQVVGIVGAVVTSWRALFGSRRRRA